MIVRIRKLRRTLPFLVVSQVTIAAQLLLLMPPAAAGEAAPMAPRVEPIERWLSMLAPVTPVVTLPVPVQVNRSAPESEPPSDRPMFSPIPTDEEISMARVFGLPLIPEEGERNDAENQAMAQAITTYLSGGDSEALEPLEGLVTAFPESRWRVAIQANVGSWYRKKGYFTRAERNLRDAWIRGKDSSTGNVRALAEFAAGELMILHMAFGQLEPLDTLVTDFTGRILSGGITERLAAAKNTVWSLRHNHAVLIPSGAMALERVRHDKHQKAEREKKNKDANYREKPFQRHPEIAHFPAKHEGASLSEIQGLSARAGLGLQMAKRESAAAAIPLPAVVHLKQGHFTALVEERGGRYRLDDPILGGEVWMSREAFEEESSGYFLVESGTLPKGWRKASGSETAQVRGKCFVTNGNPNGTRPGDPKSGGCGDSCSDCPMAQYTFHKMLASVSIFDMPVGYSPPRGPESRFRVTYNQREGVQPALFSFSNLGTRWTFDWLSYLEVDPSFSEGPIDRYVRGGGGETYQGFEGGVSKPEEDFRAVLRKTSVDPAPLVYERELSDGSVEVYSKNDGAMGPQRLFMTEWRDPQGNKLTFTYDSMLRLISATDAIGQVTTISYELKEDPLKITKVTDPFGRSARFEYDIAKVPVPYNKVHLVRIIDVAGIRSEFEYGIEDFILAMTTPYGRTTFRHDDNLYAHGSNVWVEATDPLGGTERVERLEDATKLPGQGGVSPPIAETDPPATVPAGFGAGNTRLNIAFSVYYSKLVMSRTAAYPPHPTEGEITRWRFTADGVDLSAYQVQSTKKPLENRVWYEQDGETIGRGTGPTGRPSRIGRVLDDGSSQIHRYEYGTRGEMTRYTDPLGRETVYEYAPNEIDLLRVKQKNGLKYDLLKEMTYNTAHQPIAVKGASGKTTSYTYNGQGQVTAMTTPARAGIDENRTTTYVYDLNGYLQRVTGPVLAATTRYTYDGFGRTRTVTDSDEYTLTFDYDVLDRQIRTTYPDGTFEETVYERLDPRSSRDRLGRWTHRIHDALQRVTATTDPLGRTVTQVWCSCGSLDAIIDANGNRTEWERDALGRVTKEIRANGSEWVYEYETTTSRLRTVTDAKLQVKTYNYLLDDNLQGVSYSHAGTPDVSFTYDPVFNRVKTMVDGTGTTTYSYYPIGTAPPPGAGRLSSVDGPLASDLIAYEYDELGRVQTRAIDGVWLEYVYDSLGRIVSEQNVLGSFSFDYDGLTSRLRRITYPNGQTSSYAYHLNSGDHRLHEIHHRKPDGTTLSKFTYTYDAVGNLLTWIQQRDMEDPLKAYDFEYDRADQLTRAVFRTVQFTPTVLKRYSYSYDPAGNRTVEQIDNVPVLSGYDNMNRLVSQSPGGTMRFAGTVNEPATVTIQGKPATVTSTNQFSGSAQVTSGQNQVEVKAKDYAGNQSTNTYQVDVSGSSKTFTFDANGNMTSDGTRTFEWDAENRLLAVNQGTLRSEFTYDGNSRRVRETNKNASVVISDSRFLWCERIVCQERDSSGGSITRQFFSQGVWESGSSYFDTRDHLGSTRELVDSSATIRARYDYDPFGRPTKLAGDKDSALLYAGYHQNSQSGLLMTLFRSYDPSLGRWLSEDPIGMADSTNLYSYVLNAPVRYYDPFGLQAAGGGGSCIMDDCLRQCLGQVFREPIPEIRITPEGNRPSDAAISSPNTIDLPGSCVDFFQNDRWVLHEYYHVIRQWRRGTMTGLLYLIEAIDSGSFEAPDNRYERAAEEFARRYRDRLQDCRRKCRQARCLFTRV
jgi:RHS repeat-associated protein